MAPPTGSRTGIQETGTPAPQRAPKTSAPATILVVKPSSLGDVVHTLPAVARLKRHWPQSQLSWLINPEWAPLLEGNPHVDEVVIFPRREFRGVRGVLRVLPWVKQLRARGGADLILDFQGLIRSATIGRLCRNPGGRMIGLSDAREGSRFLYDEVVDVHGKVHAVARYLTLVDSLGIPPMELEWTLPAGSPVDAVPSGYILLHPFSRGAGKSMSRSDVEAFCRKVFPRPVVIAGRADEHLTEMEHVTNLLNRTSLAELIWLIRRAAFVVSVDSGPMHMAAALTPRLLALHTWSDPLKVGPYAPNAWVWKEQRIVKMNDYPEGRGTAVSAAGISEVASWTLLQLRTA